MFYQLQFIRVHWCVKLHNIQFNKMIYFTYFMFSVITKYIIKITTLITYFCLPSGQRGQLQTIRKWYLFVETNKEMPFIFKEAPDWWLMELSNILKPIEPPNVIDRRTRKRHVFAPRDLKI